MQNDASYIDLYWFKLSNVWNFKEYTNVYSLVPENEFPEIIYAFFGGRQNIFSIIFGTKFVVIYTANILKIG